MLDRHSIEDFFRLRKIDANLHSYIDTPTFSRYLLKLGPTGKISSIEQSLREFGLLVNAIAEPVSSVDFSSGLVSIDAITANPTDFTHSELYSQSAAEISSLKVPLILGKDYTGHAKIVDLYDLPHLLLGGTTGSGKSMFLHSIINTILLSSKPIKLVLVDPKGLEFKRYVKNKVLLSKIATNRQEISILLESLHNTMVQRFSKLGSLGVTNIAEMSKDVFPYIVAIIDEVQDVLGKTNKHNEELITKIAQKGRAAGIHLVLATQHPSKDIVSPSIKSNFPARVAFKTANSTYSRVLLDQGGAENLMGKGDGIFKLNNTFIRFKAPIVQFKPAVKFDFWSLFK